MRLFWTLLLGTWLLLIPLNNWHFRPEMSMAGFLPLIEASLSTPKTEPGQPTFEVVFTSRDSLLFLEKQTASVQHSDLPARALSVAKSFLGTPYVTGTLETGTGEDERLVVNLRQLDCWTLVENSLAIAQTDSGGFTDYYDRLRQLRYWGGTIKGYGSRIHYFSGWLLQAEKNGLLRDLTREMGGIPYQKQVGYISARPGKYQKVQEAETLRALRAAEKRINAHHWYYIPKAKVAKMEHLIRDGDIIILTSAKRDLDIAHQGFAVRQNGRVHLLNASSLSRRVVISKQPLTQYMASQRGQSGIMIARLNDQAE